MSTCGRKMMQFYLFIHFIKANKAHKAHKKLEERCDEAKEGKSDFIIINFGVAVFSYTVKKGNGVPINCTNMPVFS